MVCMRLYLYHWKWRLVKILKIITSDFNEGSPYSELRGRTWTCVVSMPSLTQHAPPSCAVIIHQWHTVCFSPFLSACLRLMIQISGVHPDLCRTSPLIQPFSRCHHLPNWSYPDVSSWHNAQTVTGGCGVPGFWLLFASQWQISGNNDSAI